MLFQLHFFFCFPGTNTSPSSLRSKFKKVFPFTFSLKEKFHISSKNSQSKTDLVNYITAASLCSNGTGLPTNDDKKRIKSIIRPLEVPK